MYLSKATICAVLLMPTLCHAAGPDDLHAIDDQRIEELAASRQWNLLLHYKKSIPFGKLRSELDGQDFFFAADGKTNPRAELLANIKAFGENREVGKLKQHPQCAFPARYLFLKRELNLATKDVECPRLDDYLERFNAESATLVFSAAYPNNPGSMFGHTFLRINSKSDRFTRQQKLDVLDFGLNFAAVVPPDENSFAFVLFGIFGGYSGQFSMMPYYAKVNEYSNSESRDLWEYNLDFSEDETTQLLRHAWEIETNSHFDYYFFDENCSYQLLSLLEVAKPEWEFGRFGLHVIPAETVKRVTRIPGAVRSVTFRPSLRHQVMQAFSELDEDQKTAFTGVIDGKVEPYAINDAALLDRVVKFLNYKKQRDKGELGESDSRILEAALARRSKLGIMVSQSAPTRALGITETRASRPDLGHHPFRIGAASGISSSGKALAFQELSFKLAYHDLLNNDEGYTPFSQIEFPWVTLRHTPEENGLRLERLDILNITSLFPMTFLEKRLSWKFEAAYITPRDLDCAGCHVMHTEFGAGLTTNLFSEHAIFYALALANLDFGGGLGPSPRWGPKLQMASIINPVQAYKTQLSWSVVSDLGQSQRPKIFHDVQWAHSYSFSQSWEARVQLSGFIASALAQPYREAKFALNFYF